MNAQAQTQDLVGGWTAYHALTAEDTAVFNEAMQGFVGVKYVPSEVATQVVAGVNYRFKCTATQPGSPITWQAVLEVYAPLQGQPHITEIQRI